MKLGVGGERVGVLLEGMDLAHHLGDVSALGGEMTPKFAQVTKGGILGVPRTPEVVI